MRDTEQNIEEKEEQNTMPNMKQTFECKSVIIGRKKPKEEIINGEVVYPCFVNLCDENNPHLSVKPPFKFLDFKAHKIIIRGLNINYLIPGNDIVINNLKSITIEQDGPHLIITGVQEKHEEALKIEEGKKGEI